MENEYTFHYFPYDCMLTAGVSKQTGLENGCYRIVLNTHTCAKGLKLLLLSWEPVSPVDDACTVNFQLALDKMCIFLTCPL